MAGRDEQPGQRAPDLAGADDPDLHLDPDDTSPRSVFDT
jgi:hypothetical protein